MTKRKKIIVICAFLLISFIIPNKVKAKESASVKYQTHVQDIGWQTQVKDGEIAGTEGQSKRLEAIKIEIKNLEKAERKFETAVNSVSRSAYSGKRKKAQKAARAREQKKKKEQNRQTNKPDGQESGVPKEFMEILNRIVKERMKEQNYRNQEEEKCRKLDEKIRICQKARKEVAVAVEKEKQEKHHFFRKKKSDA